MKSTAIKFCAGSGGKMFRPEPLDLLLIAIVAMLIFGANRLPEIARGIGGALREFRRGLAEKDEEKPKS
jgi:sec-independent protein translocase protein TatA